MKTPTNNRPVPDLKWFERALETLAEQLEEPVETTLPTGVALRFANQSVQAAVLLKLARFVSGISAGEMLLQAGYLQELATIQRTLDELHEDILFLSIAVLTNKQTEDHEIYLKAFWEEEPDFKAFSGQQKNRHQISRKRIRSYLSRVTSDGQADHLAISTSAYLSRLLSGYVHGAAPQLTELIDVRTKRFRVTGYPDSPLVADHRTDFENQYFRGVVTIVIVARLLYLEELAEEARQLHSSLEPYF